MQKALETKAALQTAESRNKQPCFHFITLLPNTLLPKMIQRQQCNQC